jgi:hypothetical protein
MLHFLGSDLALDVDDVLDWRDGPILCTAHDFEGRRWLVVEVARSTARTAWLCARQSARAIECLLSGRVEVRDAIRHSLNGTVEVVAVDQGQLVEDHQALCSDLPDEDLPAPGWYLHAATTNRDRASDVDVFALAAVS